MGPQGVLAALDGGLGAASLGAPRPKKAQGFTTTRVATARERCQNKSPNRARRWWVLAGSSDQGGFSVDQQDRRRDAAKSVVKCGGDRRPRGGVRPIGATTSATAERVLGEGASEELLAEHATWHPRRPSSSNRVASKALMDVGVDAGQRQEFLQPDIDISRRRNMTRRRLLLTALRGAVLAETAGQLAERALVSESSRLRLQQKRRVLQDSVESFAETRETAFTAEILLGNVKRELSRAAAISALALSGAVGSKVVSNQNKRRELAAQAQKAPSRGLPSAESASSSAPLAAAAAEALFKSADDEAITACLTGATCSPDWSSVDEEDEAVNAAAATAADASTAAATANATMTRWGQDFDDVARTAMFSACYGGLFQPHWFKVLNSYDWSDIILPPELELQLRTLGENLHQAQTVQGVPAEGASFAVSQFLEVAGGYGDPSLVGTVSLALAAPIEAAGSFLAPLAVNQLMIIPLLYWPSFFLFTGAVEEQPLTTVLQTLHRRLPQLMKANLAFWIPAQGFQFSSVPADDQALYVAVMGVLWNGVLATMMTPQTTTTPPPTPRMTAAASAAGLPPFDVMRLDSQIVDNNVVVMRAESTQ